MEKSAVYLNLIGGTGHGKSSTGNSILMRKWDFQTGNTADSVTNEASMKSTTIDGYTVHVVDNPGIPATNVRPGREGELMKDFVKELEGGMGLCPHGVDCFMFVLNFASPRFTEEQMSTFNALEKIFSKDMFARFCIVIFTHKDAIDDNSLQFDDWCKSQGGGLGRLMKLCRYRCLLFDNKHPTELQRRQFLQIVLKMKPQGLRYTNKLFSNAIKARRQLIEMERFHIVKVDIDRNLDSCKRRLRDIFETNSDKTSLSILLKLDEIEVDAEDFFTQLTSYENTSGVYDKVILDFKETIGRIKRSIREQEAAAKNADLGGGIGALSNRVSLLGSAVTSAPMGVLMKLLGVSSPVSLAVTTIGGAAAPVIVKGFSYWKGKKADEHEISRNAIRDEARSIYKTRKLLSKL